VEMKNRKVIYFFQLMDIFKAGSFAPNNWSWTKFWDLPMFSKNNQLFVDMILLESHNLVTSSKSRLIVAKHKFEYYQMKVRDWTDAEDMESILQCGHKFDVANSAIMRGSKAIKSIYFLCIAG